MRGQGSGAVYGSIDGGGEMVTPVFAKTFAADHGMPFPYLIDETQDVARAYGVVCTPDFFGYDAEVNLQYRGRIDSGGPREPEPGAKRELFDAMKQIAETGQGPTEQIPSVGCSIKWR
jgi:hypothetical protein